MVGLVVGVVGMASATTPTERTTSIAGIVANIFGMGATAAFFLLYGSLVAAYIALLIGTGAAG